MIPAELLQRLRTQGPQPKSYGPDDIVVPDPGHLLPQSAERRARFRLTSDHRRITVAPHDVPVLLGHRIMDDEGGRLSTRVKMICWPVLAIGKWSEEDETKARKAEEAAQRNRAERRVVSCSRISWWDGMVKDEGENVGPVVVGDVVQSQHNRHVRRLWRVVSIVQDVKGSTRLLVGRRVSWKTGEVLPGRAHPITVEVVRLVPRETPEAQNEQRA
jgi:hypothetical protein